MPEWRKATSKDRKDRRRREDIDRAAARRPRSRPDISGWRPEQEVLFTNGKGLVVDRNDRAIRQHIQFASMGALGLAVQALGVKHFIHRTRRYPFLRSRKQRRKSFSILAPAFEAGPMARGKGGDFVEKKQLRIVPTPNVAPATLEREHTRSIAATPSVGQSNAGRRRETCRHDFPSMFRGPATRTAHRTDRRGF